ncbi:hypothetical protein GGR57DRAFT_207108 [Xylariaceae sp. FL1272]|nr:hypothetical protein GGR57DRAFT_207108 [Xylariaceae sp. FL1272]
MFVSLKATLALLLAPALAAVIPTAPADELTPPDALVTLDFARFSEQLSVQETTLELRILESRSPCGHGSLTINGELLAQDALGNGSGPITTTSGNVLVAQWKFTCIRLETGAEAQLLSFAAVSVDGQAVPNTAFFIQFQQTAPASILSIEGATSALIEDDRSESPIESALSSLEVELAELKALEEQLETLEQSIASKIEYITDTFDARPETMRRISNCGSFKCVMQTIYSRVKGIASHVYHGPNHHEVTDWSSSSHGWRHKNQHQPHGNHSSVDTQETHPNHPPGFPAGGDDSERPLVGSGREYPLPYVQKENATLSHHHGGARIVAIVILTNLITFSLIFLCIKRRRQQRKARWEERHRRMRAARAQCTTTAAMAAVDLIKWLRDGMVPHENGDEEKDAIMRRFGSDSEPDTEPNSDSESLSGDALSTTMEEELAQLRAVAGVVGDMVAPNGQSRIQMQGRPPGQRRGSATSSITSACPTYTSTDETLPPYAESIQSLVYVPDESVGSPHAGSMTSLTLDEHSERKG